MIEKEIIEKIIEQLESGKYELVRFNYDIRGPHQKTLTQFFMDNNVIIGSEINVYSLDSTPASLYELIYSLFKHDVPFSICASLIRNYIK